jgi:hypothetical protein
VTVATTLDVQVALGRSISDDTELAQVQYWLDAAELLIVGRLGDVSELDAAAVRYVETEAVVAKMLNPGGYSSESIDDYTYRLPSETRRVSILDEWWDLLTPAGSSAAFTITPYGSQETERVDP